MRTMEGIVVDRHVWVMVLEGMMVDPEANDVPKANVVPEANVNPEASVTPISTDGAIPPPRPHTMETAYNREGSWS